MFASLRVELSRFESVDYFDIYSHDFRCVGKLTERSSQNRKTKRNATQRNFCLFEILQKMF